MIHYSFLFLYLIQLLSFIFSLIIPSLAGNSTSSSSSDGGGTTIASSKLITTDAAIARFYSNDIQGNVVILNGYINISLDFSEVNFDNAFDSVNGEDCFKGGIKYGIYNKWTHEDYFDQILEDCDSDYVGSRWDPWAACSMLSSNTYCESNDECIPFGGAQDAYSSSEESLYICDSINYQSNAFCCEIGDLSGKYGYLEYNSKSSSIETIVGSAFEVDGIDVGGMSIVFRCHDGTKAFCAGFEEYNAIDSDNNDLGNRMWQNQSISNGASKKAYFASDDDGVATSYVYLSYFGKYEIAVNSDDIDVPGSCGSYIYYRFVFLFVCSICIFSVFCLLLCLINII